ncbi:MAG: hypothetical protein VX874_24315 [Pseudomonadota bacterium]|nr:hypothetical protein [Pseudomonadota bacterium]
MFARALLIAATLPGALTAQAYDGIFYPEGAVGWDCIAIGMDGGAVAIGGGELMGVENACSLGVGQDVRGMSATRYDMTCFSEGELYDEPVVLMESDRGVYVIRDGFVAHWIRCD